MYVVSYRPHFDSPDHECETLEHKKTYRQASLRAKLLKRLSGPYSGYCEVDLCKDIGQCTKAKASSVRG